MNMTGRQSHTPRSYSSEEVGEIIGLATELDHLAGETARRRNEKIGAEELRSIAAELGIDEAALQIAIERHDRARQSADETRRDAGAGRAVSAERRRTTAASHRSWIDENLRVHLVAYLSVMGGLTVIDAFDGSGNIDWMMFPAAGWGIGLAIHLGVAYIKRNR